MNGIVPSALAPAGTLLRSLRSSGAIANAGSTEVPLIGISEKLSSKYAVALFLPVFVARSVTRTYCWPAFGFSLKGFAWEAIQGVTGGVMHAPGEGAAPGLAGPQKGGASLFPSENW